LTAIIGVILAFGIFDEEAGRDNKIFGALLALGSAVFYATVIIMNKKISGVTPYDKTFVQLASAALVMLPYVFLTINPDSISFEPKTIILLVIIGVVHTGFAYQMYFGTLERLKAQTAALLSYIDPITAIVISALILREKISILTIIGAILILGSAVVSDRD